MAAAAALIAAVGTLISALVGAYVMLVRRDVKDVHKMVNQQRTDAARYTAVLIGALRKKGIDVPDDESLN